MEQIKLANGKSIPMLGFGLYLIPPGKRSQKCVEEALEIGYRHFDTAAIYGNERDVGLAIRRSRIPRNQIFVTTKLWNFDHGYDETRWAFERSLKVLGTDYIDLYLIHWPVPKKRKDSWKALTDIYASGRVKSIGVSNYTIKHLKELLKCSDDVPLVNQIEFHPFHYQKDILNFCREHHIQVEAYSPLTRGKMLSHPILASKARKYGKTPAQILLRWCIEHRLITLVKTVRRKRMLENFRIFDFRINAQDMRELNSLHSQDL